MDRFVHHSRPHIHAFLIVSPKNNAEQCQPEHPVIDRPLVENAINSVEQTPGFHVEKRIIGFERLIN